METYTLWVCDDNYTKRVQLDKWLRLTFTLALNAPTSASLNLAANDSKIPEVALMRRLIILRNGVVVWGGLFQTESWETEETAPEGDIYALDATDHCCYLDWRVIPRPANQDFDTRTDHADDLAKAFVNAHAAAGAAAARRFADLTVQADAHAVASVTKSWAWETLLQNLTDLAQEKAFYWRMVPSWTGAEFCTAYPLWGKDRTKGNLAGNDELIFSFDRGNVKKMSYKRDVSAHYNYTYAVGAGEGRYQPVVERADAQAVTAWKRRERVRMCSKYTATPDLEAEGDAENAAHKVSETMTVVPRVGSITPANLGDKVTIFERRYGRTFQFAAIVKSMTVEVDETGVETITPAEMVAV